MSHLSKTTKDAWTRLQAGGDTVISVKYAETQNKGILLYSIKIDDSVYCIYDCAI
jgi:hypothetical protein